MASMTPLIIPAAIVLAYWLGGLALVAVCTTAAAIEAAQNRWRRLRIVRRI